MNSTDSFDLLGIPFNSTAEVIRNAWRAKAMSLHPDVGGSHQEMIRLNAALKDALAHAIKPHSTVDAEIDASLAPKISRSFVSRDVSCFTIDALPVDSWPLLYTGALHCGPIIDEEEPYVLEFMLSDTSVESLRSLMCRCEIVPEAGGSTVHVALFSHTANVGDVETLRDLLVDAINEMNPATDSL
jgi:hypothetical protein